MSIKLESTATRSASFGRETVGLDVVGRGADGGKVRGFARSRVGGVGRVVRGAAMRGMELLEARQMLASAADVVSIVYKGKTVEAIKDSFIAQVRSGVNFAALAAKAGFSAVSAVQGGSGYFTFVTDWAPKKVESWAKKFKGQIDAVTPNLVYRSAALPNDPLLSSQYWVNNTGQANPNPVLSPSQIPQFGTAGADINLGRAWGVSTGAADGSVVVAVIDSGLDVTHPDLAANVYNPAEYPVLNSLPGGLVPGFDIPVSAAGYNFVDENTDLTDTTGHGTAVAGVIGAVGNNSLGVSGVNQRVRILGVRAGSDTLATVDILQAYDYVTALKIAGVPIVATNLSFGGLRDIIDPLTTAAIRRLTDAGVISVSAAGNDGVNNDLVLQDPTRQTANVFNPRTLTVAATDNRDQLASFSSYGPRTVDVAAPGVDILTTASRDAGGGEVPANVVTGDPADSYVFTSGTSFAAPIVAGLAALAKSAFPGASPDQIVAAIKGGVVPLASLRGDTPNAAPLVVTGGRVDAYNTLRLLLNRSAGVNTTLGGNWRGTYGSSGAFVYGDATSSTFAVATGSLTPQGTSVVAARATRRVDTRLPEAVSGTGRATSYLLSPTETIRLPLDLGATTQRVTLYAADVDRRGRVQNVTIFDTDTGRVLQSAVMSRFNDGQYLSFDLTGRVSLEITPANGRGAVLGGLFLDPTPSSPQALIGTDAGTRGNWVNVYGDQGYFLASGESSLPAGVTVTPPSGAGDFLSSPANNSNVLSLETPTSARSRSTAFYSSTSASFDVGLALGTATRRVSFYIANPGRTARSERVSVLNGSGVATTSVDVQLAPRSGQYITFDLSGTTTVRFTGIGGGAPTLSGIFLNTGNRGFLPSGSSATYVGADSATQGRWLGRYSLGDPTRRYIVGLDSQYPSFVTSATVVANGTSTFYQTLSLFSRDVRAPRNPALTSGGPLAYLATTSSVDIPLTLDDSQASRRVSAYFADYDRQNRAQLVEIVDSASGEVISSQILRDFRNGRYLTWDLSGSVILRITRIAGPSAVISGLFFD